MRYTISNDLLEVSIDSFGAELKSVKRVSDGREYMWNGDKKFWGRTSPVLFPFVGSLNNKEYVYEGKHYPMSQHGFARDLEHELVTKDSNSIWFSLKSNAETKAKYPFDFELKIGYVLKGNEVQVIWKVINADTKLMPFSIGAHPAFMCPINGEDLKIGYKVSFANDESVNKEIIYHGIDPSCGLSIDEALKLELSNGKCELTKDFFDRCAMIVEGRQANRVGLVDKEGKEYITVSFDMPLFALWSPEGKNAPFVCIEPWCGRCDHVGFDGELKDREYSNNLEAGKEFESGYSVKFN